MASPANLAIASNQLAAQPGAIPAQGKASKNQQGFEQVLGQQVSGDQSAIAAEQFMKLADNPAFAGAMSANGGYGLQSLLSASGMLDGDATLAELCQKLEAVMQVRGSGGDVTHMGCRQGLNQMGGAGGASRMSMRSRKIGGASGSIGGLCEQFESGQMGVGAVGYDGVGGTSYGLYQIASGVGSMDKFMKYLDGNAPDISAKLRAAGPANTGSRDGAMPKVWREIAEKEPKRFGDLQRDFIRQSHYEPAAQAIYEQTGVDVKKQSAVVQEVLWSTAVQHGASGAAKIFGRAVENAQAASGATSGKRFESGLIREVYQNRANQFGSSSGAVQSAVKSRFQVEQAIAMQMLGTAVA